MSIVQTAVQRPVTVFMFVTALVLFGVVSLDRLALNLLPDISYPSLTIQTAYLDSAPEEVESLITRPIEEAVGVVPGLTRLTSVSRPGQSEVVLEFSWETSMDLAGLEVREKLDLLELPRDSEKPVILRFDPSYDPILRLRLYGDISLGRLRYVAEKEIRKALESAEGVAAIKVAGGLEEQIRVEIDEKRLAELGIPITEITQVLTQENLNQAAGSLYDLDANYLVRMLNQFRSVEEIQQIVIRDLAGRKVLLGDVARVWRGSKEREIITRLDGKESVELAVYKEGDANTVTASRSVQARLQSFRQSQQWPKGVEYEIVFNQADFIEGAVDSVLSSAVMGGLLATLILFLFLRDLRSTLSIAVSIPVSIMVTFALMYQTGVTLNVMSLGGVALGVGMLVDNSIVVLEAIDRHRRAGSLDLVEAVVRGTQEVGKAVTASTLTTIAVFVPLVFVEGIAGQLFRDQALAITFSLIASLLVALTFLPMVLSRRAPVLEAAQAGSAPAPAPLSSHRFLRLLQMGERSAARRARSALNFLFVTVPVTLLLDLRRAGRLLGRSLLRLLHPVLRVVQISLQGLTRWYPALLVRTLDHKAPVLASVLILAALAVLLSFRLGAELIPPMTQGEFSFEIQLPEGTPLSQSDRVLQELEKTASAYPEVATVFSRAGGSTRNQFARNLPEENIGQLFVVIRDRQDRAAEARVIEQIRSRLELVPDLRYTFSRPTLFSFKTPVEVEIYGFELETLRAVASQVQRRLEKIEGLRDVQTTTRVGHPEIHIVFDRDRLARLGLQEDQISNTLRNKIRGDIASRYREEDKLIEILVRAEESDRQSMESLGNLVINSPAAGSSGAGEPPARVQAGEHIPIRLGAVAQITLQRGPAEVRHIRSQRAAVVSANLTGRDLATVSEEIRETLQQLRSELPPAVSLVLAGQNEELSTSYKSLVFALLLAIFLVYLVMASQFESLIHPFIILFTVPLALAGVVFSLWLTGTTVSVMVLLGVIILAGIVVNNAIVLVDFANQLRLQGFATRQALIRAGEVRLRPILMTTLTTVLGLIPMAVAWGEGSEVRAPMAVTVMGGLIFSTLLTLILIPVVYEMFDRTAKTIPAPAVSATALSPEAGLLPAQESTRS